MFNIFVQGVEGQEAGSVGQVEEGHGEGGGGQQVEDRHPLVWLLAINWKAKKRQQLSSLKCAISSLSPSLDAKLSNKD